MKLGGTVIESGGYGCIFRPQIKCDSEHVIGNTNIYESSGISKIMKYRHGMDEYDEIKKYIPLLKTIPNYNDYFLISRFSLCRPSKLTKSDLKNYDEVNCSSLKKMHITKDNINSQLDKLLMINMPYGGVDLDCYISKNLYDSRKVIEFNNKMLELLDNAILPMNQRGIYHSDLKSNNILANAEDNHLRFRIIDWGLSTIYHPNKLIVFDPDDTEFSGNWKYIPEVYRNRPFQFNVPFSSILFSFFFRRLYDEFLIKNKVLTRENIRKFLREYLREQVEFRGSGHLSNIKSIFQDMYGTPEFISSINSIGKTKLLNGSKYDIKLHNIRYIFNYLTDILMKYTKNNNFDVLGYLNEVYIKNIDIWGFIMSFLPLTEQLLEHDVVMKSKNTKFYVKLIHTSMKELIRLLLKYSAEPINIDEIKLVIVSLNKKLNHLQSNSLLTGRLMNRNVQSVKIRSKMKSMRKRYSQKVKSNVI